MVKNIYAEDILWQTNYDLKKMLIAKEDTKKMVKYLKNQISKLEQKPSWSKIVHT